MNIEQLLERLDTAETDEEISEIGQKILEIDPKAPTASWLSETMDYEGCVENLDMLERLFPE